VIPRSDGVVLGGCRHYESNDVSISHHDSAAIKERCFKLIPSLQRARVLKEFAGLRPHRSVVRVEPEVLGKLKVSHQEGCVPRSLVNESTRNQFLHCTRLVVYFYTSASTERNFAVKGQLTAQWVNMQVDITDQNYETGLDFYFQFDSKDQKIF